MTEDLIRFIKGSPEYAYEAAILIYESSHELMDFMFRDRDIAIATLTKLYKKKRGHFSHKFSTLAMMENQIVGLELGYSKEEMDKQAFWGSIYLFLNSPISIWRYLITTVSPVLDNYVPKATAGFYYVNNVAVTAEKRSGGIGQRILKDAVKRVKEAGYLGMEGDVTKVNIRAIKFYEELGLKKKSESNNQEEYKKFNLPPLIRMSGSLSETGEGRLV